MPNRIQDSRDIKRLQRIAINASRADGFIIVKRNEKVAASTSTQPPVVAAGLYAQHRQRNVDQKSMSENIDSTWDLMKSIRAFKPSS